MSRDKIIKSHDRTGAAGSLVPFLPLRALPLLVLQHHPHRLREDLLQTLLRKGAALYVLALHLLLNDFPRRLPRYRRRLRVLVRFFSLLPQVDLIPHENLGGLGNALLQLREPLAIRGKVLFSWR